MLESAQIEMFKSEGDIVPFKICNLTRQSLRKYLISFLLKNGRDCFSSSSVEELIKQCTMIDPSFKEIKLSHMDCRNENLDISFCTEYLQVKNCVQMASRIRHFITKGQWPTRGTLL